MEIGVKQNNLLTLSLATQEDAVELVAILKSNFSRLPSECKDVDGGPTPQTASVLDDLEENIKAIRGQIREAHDILVGAVVGRLTG